MDKVYGGSQFDRGNDILADDQGGFILLGSTESQGNGGKDIWLLKVDENGNDQWNNTYGNGSDDIGQSMIRTLDGGFLIRYNRILWGRKYFGWLVKIRAKSTRTLDQNSRRKYGNHWRGFQKVSDDEYMMSCSLFDNGKNFIMPT